MIIVIDNMHRLILLIKVVFYLVNLLLSIICLAVFDLFNQVSYGVLKGGLLHKDLELRLLVGTGDDLTLGEAWLLLALISFSLPLLFHLGGSQWRTAKRSHLAIRSKARAYCLFLLSRL